MSYKIQKYLGDSYCNFTLIIETLSFAAVVHKVIEPV